MTDSSKPPIPDQLRPYLDIIADRLLSGHAAVMVGAGFSKNAASNFPDWSRLGDRFYERLHGHPSRPDVKYLQVPALAHLVEAAFGRPALDQMLRDAIPDLEHEPSPLHAELLDLPWSDVFTTNYDTLLERARRSVISQRYDLVLKPDDLGHSNRPRIVKLHGSLPSEGQFTITDEDYRRYPNRFASFVNAVRQALLENTLCLIGFSGDDPNFLHWIGWLHDTLGHFNSPKMYLVGPLDLSPAQKTLLNRRNIIPVDMSLCPDSSGHPYQALHNFLSYLKLRRARDSQLAWPDRGNHDMPPHEAQEPRDLVAIWKAERLRYPGWVVLPEDLRLSLWLRTSHWVGKVPAPDALPAGLDLEFAFELTWRSTRCLSPIFDNQVPFLEATIDRHWPATGSSTLLDARPLGLTLEELRHKCHYLILAMLRYYREEGLSAKWDDACVRIQAVLPTVSPELTAQFHYERALFALFALDLQQLTQRLAEWPRNNTLPFWEAKKASLLAEIGQVAEARHILLQSLDMIRAKLNLTPPKANYTLVSQESFVMYLLHTVSQSSWPLRDSDHTTIQTQRREFQERWHVLKQYKCDPWHALETFAHKLQRPPVVRAEVTEKPAFDIGRSIQKHSPHLWNSEAFLAFNFLRFCEDAGFPFRVPGCAIATESATGTLTRIAGYSSYWALATLVRIGDDKAVDEIFDRPSLACMSMSAVDSLVERYLEALRLASSDVTTGDRLRAPNFGTLLAGILPEILSRLCCKSSGIARTRLLEWLLEVYRSEHRANYQGIGRLVRRLLESSQGSDAVDMIPRLLEFPVLADGNAIEQREYPNPFDFVDLSKGRERDGGVVRDMPLEAFFKGGASDSPAVRKWAVSTLGRLHEGGLLSRTESRRFGAVLWSRVDDDGLPAGTNYYRFAFLSLPCPVSVNPVEGFMRYVRAARFPKQESQTRTTIRHGGDDAVAICHDIGAASDVQWATDDVCSMVRRLVEWWDADKAHWRRAPAKTQVPSITEGLERHLAALVRTLATVVVRCRGSFDDDGTRDSVRRVAEECGGYGVPALRLELACAYAFGLGREAVLYRVEDAMPSSSTNVVMDALGAMDLVSQHGVSESDNGDLMQLLSGAAGMIRWRRATALGEALKAVGRVVERQPGAFMGDVERDVLTGLERLVSETAVETESGMAMDGVDRQDISRRLIVRRAAARLARRLLEHYGARGAVIPQAIEGWEKVCGSDREFLEIKNEWLALRKGNA